MCHNKVTDENKFFKIIEIRTKQVKKIEFQLIIFNLTYPFHFCYDVETPKSLDFSHEINFFAIQHISYED